jgi:uncharacterized protein (DUF983 family)
MLQPEKPPAMPYRPIRFLLLLLATALPSLALAQGASQKDFPAMFSRWAMIIIGLVIIGGLAWLLWEVTVGNWWRNKTKNNF